MFTQLLASRPVRQRSAPGALFSIAAHAAVFAGAIYATTVVHPLAPPVDNEGIVYVDPEPLHEPPPPAPPDLPAPTVPTDGIPVPVAPVDVTNIVPLVDLKSLPSTSTTWTPPPLRSLGGTHLAASTPLTRAPGAAYFAQEVDVEVSILNGSVMPKFPTVLRAAAIEGDARVRFIVDTVGRVEMASVEDVSSTNPAFAMAVREALPRMRFRPARVAGRPVRQLVEFPVTFRLSR